VQALAEAARVVKAGGDFLLDARRQRPMGEIRLRAGALARRQLAARLGGLYRVREAGFQIIEQGSRPLTLYLLARRS
jgi:ubiquinone/menaquinone biosynthesis C-methylase UbiE